MNTNERKPLLSDRACIDATASDRPTFLVRDFYEDLIKSGRLRVVEDVDVVLMDGSSIMGHCNGCGTSTLKQHPHCPGCGNKIKR